METKKMTFDQMELMKGGEHLRDCLIDGAVATVGLVTAIWGGWPLAIAGIADAARRGCFD